MKLDKTHLIVFIAGAILGLVAGFFTGKGIYDRPIEESVSRDTVTLHDTIPHYYPQPKERQVVRYVTRLLPVKYDTINHFREVTQMIEHLADTSNMIPVEVPITSKHYSAPEYDAWVSGYEPNLDSIFVYREKQIITETITRTAKENKHFFLDISGGCNYITNTKTAVPFAELGLKFKIGKLGIGAYGGCSHDMKENKATPYAEVRASYDIISF